MTESTPASTQKSVDPKDHRIDEIDPPAQRIWDYVSHSQLRSLWNFEGTPPLIILKRTAKSFIDDDLLSRAAELGYYFLFALFPMLICASALLGLAARGATSIYVGLLHYFSIVVPHSAYQLVIHTFDQTARASTGRKATLGLLAALWTASMGFAAIQDALNLVYKVRETRPYWKSRGLAVLMTILLWLIATLNLADLFGGDLLARYVRVHIGHPAVGAAAAIAIHIVAAIIACGLLMLIFSMIYYFAPDLKTKCWDWLTPGAAFGVLSWLLASAGLRAYLHYFNSYTLTYGSLGAVIILMTWFYITGLTLLTGAELNSEIQAAVVEKRLKEAGQLPPQATTDHEHPIPIGDTPIQTT